MSSKVKLLSIFAAVILGSCLVATSVFADVTGNFGTHFSLRPQSTASELSLVDFDVQNELNVTAVISGLSSTFHTHFGIAGVEDLQLISNVSLGALDIEALLVFGRFAFGSFDPFYDSLHFIKKAVTANLQLGGVTFSNLAVFEDTNAFVSQSTAYAFGDVFAISGSTPSGILIEASTGICMEQIPNSIKKHFEILEYSVNPHCATEPKPDILFDFETITIEGVPVAPNVTAESTINCVRINACELTTLFSFAGGPVPFEAELVFSDLLSLSFSGAEIVFNAGAGTFTLFLTPAGELGLIELKIEAVINPDTNPATVIVEAEVLPGVGLASGIFGLEVQRAGLIVEITSVFAGGNPAQFAGITFELEVPGDLLSIEAFSVFDGSGLLLADVLLTISF